MATHDVSGFEIWKTLGKALGLEGREVITCDIRIRLDEPVTITLTELMDRGGVEGLVEVFSRYTLTRVDEA